jgi:hypothetical protein
MVGLWHQCSPLLALQPLGLVAPGVRSGWDDNGSNVEEKKHNNK